MSSLIISYDIGFPSSSAMLTFGTFKVLSNNIIMSPVMFRNDRLCINMTEKTVNKFNS